MNKKQKKILQVIIIILMLSCMFGVIGEIRIEDMDNNLMNICYGENITQSLIGKMYVSNEGYKVAKKCQKTSLDETYTCIYNAMLQYTFCSDETMENKYTNSNIYNAMCTGEMVCRGCHASNYSSHLRQLYRRLNRECKIKCVSYR